MPGRWAGRCRATQRTRVATTVIELDAEPDRQPITHWRRTTGSLDRPRLSGTSMTIHTLYDTLLDGLSLARSLSTTLSRLVERRLNRSFLMQQPQWLSLSDMQHYYVSSCWWFRIFVECYTFKHTNETELYSYGNTQSKYDKDIEAFSWTVLCIIK